MELKIPPASIEESEMLSVATCGMQALPENFANPEFKKHYI